jgi:NAD-dependent dihydropyrimidine dehydrogenase PreA subunit
VIAIRQELCDGCGVCIETCPEGALYLVDSKAMVDADLCRGCEACIPTCPREAIFLLSQSASTREDRPKVPVPRPEPGVIRVRTPPVPASWRSGVLPLLGATAAWAARELGPVMAEYLVGRVERRLSGQSQQSTPGGSGTSKRIEVGGGRRRRRHRGGRNGSA